MKIIHNVNLDIHNKCKVKIKQQQNIKAQQYKAQTKQTCIYIYTVQ